MVAAHRSPYPQALVVFAALFACRGDRRDCTRDQDAPGENILLIVSDDIGVDKTGTYAEHPTAPDTPNLDRLAAEGVLFRNAYANPTCSPSRASLLTGRQASRTGVGRWIAAQDTTGALPLSELTLPEMLRGSPSCYATMAAGKWHLVLLGPDDAARHPLDQGFGRHRGSLSNPGTATTSEEEHLGYFHWEKAVDGKLRWSDTYMATDTTDEALTFIQGTDEPWFAYVAYNLAHVPRHTPPRDLQVVAVPQDPTDAELHAAMVAALDAEVGRLLDGIPDAVRDNTTIIYLSDNGTPSTVIEAPWNPSRSKGTLYDGGVRVPLIVAGPHVAVPGSESDALVHVVDVFPTVAALAQVDLDPSLVLDGQSLQPYLADPDTPGQREFLYTESFYPNGDVPHDWRHRMVRDSDWKLMRLQNGDTTEERLYRYEPGAFDEGYNLLDQELDEETEQSWARLGAELDAWEETLGYGP